MLNFCNYRASRKLVHFFLYFSLGIASCKSKDEKFIKFDRYIPDIKNGKSDMLYRLQGGRDSLKLDTIENGYDSFELRIWLTYRIDTFQIIVIKNTNHIWNGIYYEVVNHLNYHRDSLLYYSKIQKPIYPKNGWIKLIDSLIKLNIMILPDWRKIMSPNELPLDGASTVAFETANTSQYRLFSYELPSAFKSRFEEAYFTDTILNLVSEEFGIKYLRNF